MAEWGLSYCVNCRSNTFCPHGPAATFAKVVQYDGEIHLWTFDEITGERLHACPAVFHIPDAIAEIDFGTGKEAFSKSVALTSDNSDYQT